MSLFDNENPVFINFAGIVDELDQVQLIPLHQSVDRPKLPGAEGDSEFAVRIHYEGDGLIERHIHSSMINACGTEKRFGIAQTGFWISLPYVKGADLIQMMRRGKVIFEQRLDALPSVSAVTVKTVGDRLDISWRSNSKGIAAYSAALKLANGKSIPLGTTDKKRLAFNLEGLPKGGRGQVEVTASDGVLSVSAASNSFAIKASAPLGAIISPTDGAQFSAFTAVSLLASCSDAFGDQLNWKTSDFGWRIDGRKVSIDSRMGLLTDLQPGKHTVELVSKKWGVLSKAEISVSEYSDGEKRHADLFAALKREQTEIRRADLRNSG